MTPSPRLHPPSLSPSLRARFDDWIEDGLAIHAEALSDRELRTGVQALSALYVEGRDRGRLAARSLAGAAKRAAFATYYAALHFLTVHALVAGLREDPRFGPGFPGRVDDLLDLGCGTGASGAAAATAVAGGGPAPRVLGVDVSGWALADARRTFRAFGLRGRTRRRALPGGAGRPGDADLAVAGWASNELDPAARRAMLDWFRSHLERGGALLVVEPLAGPSVPWWSEWRSALAPFACVDGSFKAQSPRVALVERLDRASGLDHRQLGARWLAGPVRGGGGASAC